MLQAWEEIERESGEAEAPTDRTSTREAIVDVVLIIGEQGGENSKKCPWDERMRNGECKQRGVISRNKGWLERVRS